LEVCNCRRKNALPKCAKNAARNECSGFPKGKKKQRKFINNVLKLLKKACK